MRTGRFNIKWREFRAVAATEFRNIIHDGGLILIMVLAILIYTTVYSLAYSNEVLRDIPIAVVDQSQTSTSRQLIRSLNSAENINVDYQPASMDEAEELFYDRKVYGIVYIPADLETRLLGGQQAKVGVYVDASYFLMYRQAYSDIATVVVTTGAMVNYVKLVAGGATTAQAEFVVQPVQFVSKSLYNPYLGYGTFLMPAIIIIIIQQTLLIGIGMVGGTWRERNKYRELIIPGERRLSTVPIVLGKTLVYIAIYSVTLSYILALHYRLFHFPMNATAGQVLGFMFPYVLACCFMGIAASTLFRYRENSIIFLLWTSIPILLLSGASIPKEAMPEWMYWMGKIFPSSSGVEGWLRLQTMGAELRDIEPQLINIWLLVIIYFVLACVAIRVVIKKVEKEESAAADTSDANIHSAPGLPDTETGAAGCGERYVPDESDNSAK